MQTKEDTSRILYVSHRYHTNQVPVMKGWHEQGVKVMFMAGYQGEIESHEYVEYYQMKLSIVSKIIYFFLDIFCKSVRIENKKMTWFIPDFYDTFKQIRFFKPHLVVLRGYRFDNVIISIICKILGIKHVVNYTQAPLNSPSPKNKLYLSLIGPMTPHVTFTPVLYKGKERKCKPTNNIWHAPHYFVPLVCVKPTTERTEYCVGDKIRILDIGKYREYKNHFFIVDALSRVEHPERFEVTIIGQLSNKYEKDYYQRLQKYIQDKRLEKMVHLRGHVDFKEISKVYANNDVLLLASSEPASISVLESMSKGLCVIASVENGTTCYLDEYQCGITFSNGKIDSLINALNEIDGNSTTISDLGQKAQRIAKEEFCFDRYKEALNNLLQTEFNYSIQV